MLQKWQLWICKTNDQNTEQPILFEILTKWLNCLFTEIIDLRRHARKTLENLRTIVLWDQKSVIIVPALVKFPI